MTKFNLIEKYDLTAFEVAVNELLEAGWQLHGPTQVIVYPDTDGPMMVYVQALVGPRP